MKKFDPSKPLAVVTVDGQGVAISTPREPVADVRTDSERILAAQSDWMETTRNCNRVGEFGFAYPPAFYEDFAGAGTSAWMFEMVTWLLYALHSQQYAYIWLNSAGNYLRREGVWVNGEQRVPIEKLKSVLSTHIKNLGLSEPVVWEHFSKPMGLEGSIRWNALTFDQQIEKLKGGA